jgi:hypothetical protein
VIQLRTSAGGEAFDSSSKPSASAIATASQTAVAVRDVKKRNFHAHPYAGQSQDRGLNNSAEGIVSFKVAVPKNKAITMPRHANPQSVVS